MNDPSSPQGAAIAESRKRREQQLQAYEQYSAMIAEEQKSFTEARTDYYSKLQEKYGGNGRNFSEEALRLMEVAQPAIDTAEDKQLMKERIAAADMYADFFNVSLENAYLNLDNYHQLYTGQQFVKKSGLQAVVDSFAVSYLSMELNSLAIDYHKSKQDPEVMKAIQETSKKLERMRDHVPKIWQDEYTRQGGWADISAFFRSITTSAAENALPMGIAIGAGAIAATGVGAIIEGAALPAGLAGVLVTAASGLAVAETTAHQTVGLEYYELISQGIPDDIAWNNANLSAQIQGAIEVVGGGVVAGTTSKIIGKALPNVAEKVIAKWFIKGKMGAGAKMFLDYLQEVAGEAFEEGTQQITSVAFYNRAAEQANERRDALLKKIYNEPLEDIKKELEKELENHPEIKKKDFDEAWEEIKEATWGGLGTALLLGIPGARIGYKNNLQSAQVIADIARAAPSEAAFIETINKAKEQGLDLSVLEGMKTDTEKAVLKDIFKVQQERLTPEQREAKEKAVQDAEALAEVTDYRNAETVERKDEETGETITELAAKDTANIYHDKDGKLEIAEYTDTKEDGSIDGRYVAGDPRINDKEQTGANHYGYINYTQNENNITIDEFKMASGYENLRAELYQQFAERFAGMEITWNPSEQNLKIKEELINQNPRGPKEGLNYHEKGTNPKVSNEARQVAQRFTPFMKKNSPLEIALTAEAFRAFYQRRGESLNGAMNRLIGSITNEAPGDALAAQRNGYKVNGATWLAKTAEGIKRIIYLNKNSADASTVLHETAHVVEADFTDAERRIANRALNGYVMSKGQNKGTTVYFDENTTTWTPEQQEAFTDALENYCTNGTAPNEQIKGLFEKIKEFMKRIYQTLKGWTELSPQVEEFYQSLFSGELVDQARAEEAQQSRQEARGEAQTEKTINDTEQGAETTNTPREADTDKTHRATPSHTETQEKYLQDLINNPDIPYEEKAKAVLDLTGLMLLQTEEQQKTVYNQYHNEDGSPKEGWLKAPNGQKTNLTEDQWLTVRTQNFKNWFGDWENDPSNASKVIDKNGEPLAVWHGGTFGTEENFIPEGAMHFGSEKAAQDRKESKPGEDLYRSIKVEYREEKKGFYWTTDLEESEETYETVKEARIAAEQAVADYRNMLDYNLIEELGYTLTPVFLSIKNPIESSDQFDEWEPVIKNAKENGNDGIIYRNDVEDFGSTSYIAFNPAQIKSATDNAGTFDPRNPSILYQIAYHGSAQKFDQFDSSHMGEGEGAQAYGWGHYFTDKKEIAEYYRETSASRKGLFEKTDKKKFSGRTMGEWYNYWEDKTLQTRPPEIKKVYDRMNMIENLMLRYNYEDTIKYAKENEYSQEAIDWFKKTFEGKFKTPGQTYMVDIPENHQMLDWDKKLNEQPENVRNKIGDILSEIEDRTFQDEKGKDYFLNNFNGSVLYRIISNYKGGDRAASEYLNSMGIKGIRYLDAGSRDQGEGSHNYVVFSDDDVKISNYLLQSENRNMMEEAASYDSYEEWREFTEACFDEPMGEFEYIKQMDFFTEEQIDAWYKTYWKNARKAVDATEEQTEGKASTEKTKPAELDKAFLETIEEPGALEDFVETAAVMHNEDYSNWGAVDEEDAAKREKLGEVTDELRQKLKHPTWQSIFMARGKMGQTQRKQILTMIQNSPREYRAIYAAVMEREDMAVSAEDTTAEALKHRITDSRRQDVDSLTPEKLRQLAEQLDIEDFAEKVRTGRAEFNDPIEKAYIKQLQEQRQKAEETLKEVEADRQEDNEYIERMAGKKFNETFERALKAREYITRKNEKLDKAIKNGQSDAARIAFQLQRAQANYNTILKTLEALARAQQLEIDVQAALSDERVRDAVKASRTETKEIWQGKFDALQEEYKDYRKSAKTEATLTVALARKAAREELRKHIDELKQKQKSARELREAKKGVTKRILRPISPHEVNADQGRAVAIIQRLIEPSMLEGLDRFIGGIEKPYLRTIFETWKVDEKLRETVLKGKAEVTKAKLQNLLNKAKFEDLTGDEKKYLYIKIPPKDWATALGLDSIIKRRNENYPGLNGETEKQIALQHLPQDVFYRIMDKPFSEWTLQEGQELAKIIDDLTVEGKQIYKANIDAERRRIRDYQAAVRNTIRTVTPGTKPEDIEKILGKYDEGVAGTAQAAARRRNIKGPLFGYADMNIYRFARMLDNGDTSGKNSAALYRGASDAYNAEKSAVDTRTERLQKRMKTLEITESELWQKSTDVELGGDLGKHTFTAAELIGFISATRDDYSRAAVMYGNLLSENERGPYQRQGITRDDMEPLLEMAEERYAKVEAAAQRLITENPNYLQLLAAIDEDFTAGGIRLSDALTRYNNSFMPIVEHYFPMNRQAAVSASTADAQLARELMGSSSGAFKVFVEKGFTNKRVEIPPQYQTAIKLDILGVWSDAINKEEHFIAYGQLVKDLNGIYKQSRQVIDAIQNRYGRKAVDYINKYINELANPNHERIKSSMDNFIKTMRGNTAAAYLAWKTSGIVKQFITSPAPFFGYMNPIEYWGVFVEYATHRGTLWNEIKELSEHMEHRSANLLTDIVKEQAKQKFDNKLDAAISQFNKRGMEGLEWIDNMCVAPGWLVLFRKEHKRLTRENSHGNLSEKDIRVKAAQYADDITRATQPSSRVDDLAPLFKTESELGKAMLQFTASLNVIWQNIRYDLPQMIRDRRYKNAVGTVMGYAIAGIILGAVTAGFNDDDDEAMKAKKLAWWTTTQFTDAFPIIGSEATHFAERIITGKMQYRSGINLLPTLESAMRAGETTAKVFHTGEFDKLLKAAAQATEAAGIYKGLPVSGVKELGALIGIGDGDGELNVKPGALAGRR